MKTFGDRVTSLENLSQAAVRPSVRAPGAAETNQPVGGGEPVWVDVELHAAHHPGAHKELGEL
jgi:hypothetical protein